jgi:hypothetical protein
MTAASKVSDIHRLPVRSLEPKCALRRFRLKGNLSVSNWNDSFNFQIAPTLSELKAESFAREKYDIGVQVTILS